MKSIKRGRAPSKLGFVGSIFVAIIGVFWCIMAGALGAWFMVPFGLLFVGFAVYQAAYHHHNATSGKRYSEFDIVDSAEEPDPLNEKYGQREQQESASGFCPYCGRPAEGDFEFCPKCGKKLPK